MNETATTAQPVKNQWFQLPPDATAGAPIGVAVTIIGTILWLRRRVSRDNTEVAKDKGEKQLVERLITERDLAAADAREAWKQRNADAQSIARLEARLLAMEEKIQDLNRDLKLKDREIKGLRRVIKETNPEAAKLWSTDFGDMEHDE